MSSTETELKYLLSRKSFRSIYHCLCVNRKPSDKRSSLIRQVNYYFASPDSPLAWHPINIRIRFIGKKSELTCKIPILDKTTDTIQNSYEYNSRISRKEAFHFIENGLPAKTQAELFSDMLENHPLLPLDLVCYGHLRTARFSFPVEDDLPPLLLDINAYLGTFDYELEWELDQIQKADIILKGLFEKLNISPIGRLKPKRRRFLERLQESTGVHAFH